MSGELDMASAEILQEALQPVVRAGDHLVLDVGDLTFIDSTGIRALLQLAARMNGSAPIVLSNVPMGVRRLLDIVGLDSLPGIEVEDDA